MATTRKPRLQAPRLAAVDLSEKIFHAVKIDGSGEIVLAGAGDEDICYGVLMNEPIAGDFTEVATVGGGAKAKLSDTVTVGSAMLIAADGTFTAAGTGTKALGRFWAAGVDGDIVEAEIQLFTTDS